LVLLPSFFSGLFSSSGLLGLLPDQLLQLSSTVTYFNLYEIGGRVTGAMPVLFLLYAGLYVLMPPVLYRVYCRAEVK